MRGINYFSTMLLVFFAFLGCKKAPLPESSISPLSNKSYANNPTSTVYINNVPKDGVYYLCYLNNSTQNNYLSRKDTLIVKNIAVDSVEITMRLNRTYYCIYNQCTIYRGSLKMLHYNKLDSLVIADLNGKCYQVYGASSDHTASLPIQNSLQNIRTNGDTLRFNFDYEYVIKLDGKDDLRGGNGKFLFVKAK